MAYCDHCGSKLDSDVLFCENCGAKVADVDHSVSPPAETTGKRQTTAPPAGQPQPARGKSRAFFIFSVALAAFGLIAICAAAAIHFGAFGGNKTEDDYSSDTRTSDSNKSDDSSLLDLFAKKKAAEPVTASTAAAETPAMRAQVAACPEGFAYIPPGSFIMGSPGGEYGRNNLDIPRHQAEIAKGFCLAKYETTLGEWQSVMGTTPKMNIGNPSVRNLEGCGPLCPVIWVSWDDAQAYIQRYSNTHGVGYRLPTEAEWEYVARAGSSGAYPNGDYAVNGCEFNAQLDRIAWYCGNSDNVNYPGWKSRNKDEAPPDANYFFNNGGVHPVGSKAPNSFGVYDIIGNVREWMQDTYASRGGSWFNTGVRNRISDRQIYKPSDKRYNLGFRLAYDVYR